MVWAMVMCVLVVQQATVHVEVKSNGRPIGDAEVSVAGVSHSTDAKGIVITNTAPGQVEIKVSKDGYATVTTAVVLAAGQTQQVVVTLDLEPTLEEEVVVSATRTNKRVEDQPMRVEVVPGEEVQEKNHDDAR